MFFKKKNAESCSCKKDDWAGILEGIHFPLSSQESHRRPSQALGPGKEMERMGSQAFLPFPKRKNSRNGPSSGGGGLSLFEENKISLQWRWRRKIMRRRRKEKLMD